MDENEHIFFNDLKFPGQYYGALIRSPTSHGKLLNILPPNLPDGYFLYTAADIPGKNYLEISGATIPIFAPYELNYAGEPVGILVGPEYETVSDLAEKVELHIDTQENDAPPGDAAGASSAHLLPREKPGDGNPTAAAVRYRFGEGDCEPFFTHGSEEGGGPRAEEHRKNPPAEKQGEDTEAKDAPHADGADADGAAENEAERGEAGTPGESAEKKETLAVIESTIEITPQHYFYAEPLGAIVRPKKNKLEVYTATQWPFHVRKIISLMLDCAPENIIVAPTEIVESLDGKIWLPSLIAAQTALASFLCKKPVKLVFSRNEDFLYTLKSAPAKITYKTAVDPEGKLKALAAHIGFNGGAYTPFLSEIVARAAITATGFYNVENREVTVSAEKTHLPPMGAVNGFGEPSVFLALENHMALVANKLDILPNELKKTNAPDERSVSVIDKVCAASAFPRKFSAYENLNKRRRDVNDGPLRGIGLSWGYQGNGFATASIGEGQYSVEMTMKTNGEVHIKSGFYSTSMKEILITIAAETFGIDQNLITLTGSDTTDMSSSGPDTLSSKVSILAPLVEKCCASIQRQRFRKPLPITVKKTYKPQKAIPKKEAKATAKTSAATETIQPSNTLISTTPGACVVELELQPLNYDIKIRGVWISCAAGRLFNRHVAENTVRKTVKEAVSKITLEDIRIENGTFKAKDGVSFDMTPALYIPDPQIFFIESKETPCGLGSIACNLLPGAYAAAIAQITRRPPPRIAIDSEYIYNCLEETRGGGTRP